MKRSMQWNMSTEIHPVSHSKCQEHPVIEISSGTYRVPRRNQILAVVSGCGWLTIDDRDVIVEAGDHTPLLSGKSAAILSSVDGLPLRFSLLATDVL